MELIGRLTSDAVVNELKDDRKVVNFTIAINDYYKSKDSDEGRKETLFVSCSYWLNTKLAEKLKKGCIVEIYGRLRLRVYKNAADEARASLNCHVNRIKIHTYPKVKTLQTAGELPASLKDDDLPF